MIGDSLASRRPRTNSRASEVGDDRAAAVHPGRLSSLPRASALIRRRSINKERSSSLRRSSTAASSHTASSSSSMSRASSAPRTATNTTYSRQVSSRLPRAVARLMSLSASLLNGSRFAQFCGTPKLAASHRDASADESYVYERVNIENRTTLKHRFTLSSLRMFFST